MSSSSKWKSSPLGKIPADWNVEKGDILAEKITKGASPNWQGFSYVEEGVLFVTSENVRDGFLDVSAPKFVEAAFNEKQKNSRLRQGDILINLVGASIGRSCRFDTALPYPANINQAVCLFRPNGAANADYLKHFLQAPTTIARLVGSQADGARPNVSLADIRAFHFLLPALPEQQKIAAILSTWDRAIELTEKLIAAKQKRKQALMQQLLTGKVRFKEFKGKPWTWVELGRLTKQVKRPIVWDEDQLYKLASIRRHSKGMFFREPAYGHQIKVKKLFTVEKNDFLISNIQAAYGAMGLVPKKFDSTYISDQYTVLEAIDEKKFDIHFLGFVSETAWFRQQILLACNGFFAERLRLLFSADELLKRKLFVPPSIKEQRRVVEVLQTAVRELRSAEKRLKYLKEQKKGLMQQLLTGKVRVNLDSRMVEG